MTNTILTNSEIEAIYAAESVDNPNVGREITASFLDSISDLEDEMDFDYELWFDKEIEESDKIIKFPSSPSGPTDPATSAWAA